MTATFVMLGLALIAFVSGRIPPVIVAVGTAFALWATGVLTLPEALAGFGHPIVIFVTCLFIVSEALDANGVMSRAGALITGRATSSPIRVLVIVMSLAALLTTLVNSPVGAIGTLLPVLTIIAVRLGIPTSRLLMPAALGAHSGSMLALTGTPVNIIVSDFAAEYGGRHFGFFEFGLVGVPLVIGTILLAITIGRWLLPDRVSTRTPQDLSMHAATLARTYFGEDSILRLRVLPGSPLIGAPFTAAARLLGVRDDRGRPRPADKPLAAGDECLVREPAESAGVLVGELGLAPVGRDGIVGSEFGLAEAVVAPRSRLIGEEVRPGTALGSLLVLAVLRDKRDTGPGPVFLATGDALLLQGNWDDLAAGLRGAPLVDPPATIRRQAAPIGRRGWLALGIVLGMIVLLSTGAVPAAAAGLLAAGAMLLTKVISVERALRAVSWSTIIVIASLIPMSSAFISTGAASLIGDSIVEFVGRDAPHLALLAVCLVVVVLGQFIGNMPTALIIAPIAVSVAVQLDVSVLPFLMALTVSAANSFLTPIATPANLVILEPGGYRFGDYARYGIVYTLLFLAAAVLLVPLIWPF